MRKLHFIMGILGILAFIGTGQYMDITLKQMQGMDDGVRMLYRSAHIYILLAAFPNIILSIASINLPFRWQQVFLSWLCLLMPVMMVLEFFYGEKDLEAHRDYVFYSVLGILICSGCLIFSKLVMKKFYSDHS
jgi:hypothetical protein